MDVYRYKFPGPRFLRWPRRSDPVQVEMLSRGKIEEARQKAKALFEARGLEQSGIFFELQSIAEVLAVATATSSDAVLSSLSAPELVGLYKQYHKMVEESFPDLNHFNESLRKKVCKDPDIILDGKAAYMSENAGAFYGKPESELTDGQLAYFAYLKAAFREFHVEGHNKLVSNEWLNSKD